MAVRNAGNGENGRQPFNLNNDDAILSINSPQFSAQRQREAMRGDPHAVILKDVDERWAIAAFDWIHGNGSNGRVLGVRWFWRGSGFPQTNGIATWAILPDTLSRIILRGAIYKLSEARIKLVEDFLDKKVDGQELRNEFHRKGEKMKQFKKILFIALFSAIATFAQVAARASNDPDLADGTYQWVKDFDSYGSSVYLNVAAGNVDFGLTRARPVPESNKWS